MNQPTSTSTTAQSASPRDAWAVYDATTGARLAFGYPADYTTAKYQARKIANQTGRAAYAVSQPSLAECDAQVAVIMARKAVRS